MEKKQEKNVEPANNESLSDSQKLMIGIAGKVVRKFLGTDYLQCNCSTCQVLQKLHQNSDPYVQMVEKMIKE